MSNGGRSGDDRYVRIDRKRALRETFAHADWIERANPGIFLGRHAEALAHAARLRKATLEDVLWVEFGDDPDNTRSFVLWPGERIKFGYSGPEDEELARPLLVGCARADAP